LNNSLQIIYSNYNYILITITIFLILFFTLSVISEFLFLEPFITFVVYPETSLSFLLIVILSIFSAFAISMNIYRVKLIKETKKIGSSIIGTVIGASAGACSCGPIAFSIITTFGTAGSIASSFLTIYEIPIRLTSIGILGMVILVTATSLSRECKVKF